MGGHYEKGYPTGNYAYQLINKWVIRISPAVFLSCFLLLSGCLGKDTVSTGTINLDELPVSVPEPVLTVDAFDTMLFAFLYPYSTPLDDGSVLLADTRRSQEGLFIADGIDPRHFPALERIRCYPCLFIKYRHSK